MSEIEELAAFRDKLLLAYVAHSEPAIRALMSSPSRLAPIERSELESALHALHEWRVASKAVQLMGMDA